MIDSIRGNLIHKEPAYMVIEAGGVGYGIHVSTRTSEKFTSLKKEVSLLTYLNVREDALELFGFDNPQEKTLFLKLISVSGIGPKMALRLLSETKATDIIEYIVTGNTVALTRLKGIGKKTAEILVANLRQQFEGLALSSQSAGAGISQSSYLSDSIQALIALGVKEPAAIMAVEKIKKQEPNLTQTSEIVSRALKIV